MNESTNEAITGLFPQNIKSDLLYFKDDILKDMRGIQKTLDSKFFQSEDNLNLKLNKFETKINLFEQKIFELSKKINTDNNIKENVELLNKFKEETSETIFKRRAKYNEFEKRINGEINRLNDILINSVIYPSFIGNNSKFKTFHEYMDYTLEEIGQFKVYKDKTGLDLGPFKRKIDQSIETLKLQMNNITNISKEFTINSIEQSEERIKNIIKIYDDRLQDSRVDNSHFNVGLDKKFEELKEEFNKMDKIQDNLTKKFEKHINDYNNLEEIFNYYNNEIGEMNNKINKLNYIIKELLSQKNIKIKEKKGKIFSGVKQYIKGNLNALQLSTMKNFKKYEDTPYGHGDIIKRTSTEFRQQNFTKNDLSKSTNNTNNNLNKNFELQKSYLNMKSDKFNYLNSLSKEIQEEKNDNNKNRVYFVKDLTKTINNKIYNKMEEIKEEELLKKTAHNYSNRTEKINSKYNDDIDSNRSKDKKRNEKENNYSGEKRRNSKNSLKFSNTSNDSNDSKKELVLNFSEESKNENNKSKKINIKNEYVNKEEDKNNKSNNIFLKIKEDNKDENNKIKIYKGNKDNIYNNKLKEDKLDIIENKKDFINDKINNMKSNKKDVNEKINDNNNSIKHSNNNNLENNNGKNYNYKISLNSIKKNDEYNYVPILEILNSAPNDNKKIRSQSSKKRNINNIKLLNKNINTEKNPIYNTYRIKNHSNNKDDINTNYQNNIGYQNFPYLNKDKNINKKKSIPKSALNRTKLNKFNSATNMQYNNSQKTNNNKYNRTKFYQTLNPDKIFANAIFEKKSKKIGKNKSIGIGYERSNEAKQIEDLFYKLQSYIPTYESYLTQDEY